MRTQSVLVREFGDGLRKFATEMKKTMKAKKGLGLAAPQVGENMRLIVVTLEDKKVLAMANPVILKHSDDVEVCEEGCLSLPGIYEQVSRYASIVVEFKDLDKNRQMLQLFGMDARVVQHEIDHLNGVLFVDRVRELEAKAVIL